MPLSMMKNLPPKAKKLFEEVYMHAKAKGMSPEKAGMMATGAVKHAFGMRIFKEHAMKSCAVKFEVVKSGFLFPDYSFDLVITNDDIDDDGQCVSRDVISKLANTGEILKVGDVDHEEYCKRKGEEYMQERAKLTPEEGTIGLYFLKGYGFDGKNLVLNVGMNKSHSLYKRFLTYHKQGKYRYGSAHFYNSQFDALGNMVDAERMGWTITDNPRLRSARMISGLS